MDTAKSIFHGRIIAFEGLDNSFKETNYKAFVSRLRSLQSRNDVRNDIRNLEIKTESFPRYGTQPAIMLEKWLDGSLDRQHMKDHPIATCNLYCMDRLAYWYESVHGMERNIDKLKNQESVFIFDRYSSSNAIYNPMTNLHNVSVVDLLYDEKTYGIPTPDIVVWMRMRDFGVLEHLIAKKANKDLNELDTSYIREVWERSERAINSNVFASAGINLIVIDVLNDDISVASDTGIIKSREQLADEIWRRIIEEAERL